MFETRNGKSFYFFGMDETGRIKFFCQGRDVEAHYEVLKVFELLPTSSNQQLKMKTLNEERSFKFSKLCIILQYNEIYALKGFQVAATNPAFVKEGGNPIQVEFVTASTLEASDVQLPAIKPEFVQLNGLDGKIGGLIGKCNYLKERIF